MFKKKKFTKWFEYIDVYEKWKNEREKYEDSYKDIISFDDTYISLTSMIKNEDFRNFRNLAKNMKDKIDVSQYEQIFQPTINPATFGTFASEYISFIIDPKNYKIKIKEDPWYRLIPDNIKARMSENNFDYITFVAITYAVECYRVGPMSSFPIEKLIEIGIGTFNNSEFESDYKAFKLIISKQVEKYTLNKKVLLNPVFGSVSSGVSADGDLIIDNHLVEIKCSISKTFKIDYARQLISYKFLNDKLDKPFVIDNTFIYWNPFYDIFLEIDLGKMFVLEQEFNKARIDVVNQARMRLLMPRGLIFASHELSKIKDRNPKKRLTKIEREHNLLKLKKYLEDPKMKKYDGRRV